MLLRRRLRCGVTDALTYFLVASSVLIFAVVCMILYGTRTQHPQLPSIVKGILPAGRCQCEYSTTFACDSCLECAGKQNNVPLHDNESEAWQWGFERDANNYGLSEEQCSAAFPGQYEDLERAKRYWLGGEKGGKMVEGRGGVKEGDLKGFELSKGMVRGMVFDGELYILQTHLVDSVNREKALATLSALHRALVTWHSLSPSSSSSSQYKSIPNIEFLLSVEDLPAQPNRPLWSLSRRAQDEALWLMPDFGFWSWDMPSLGTFSEVSTEIVQREKEEVSRIEAVGGDGTKSWEKKKDKLVWRGNLAFAPKLRHALVDAAKGKKWSDVGSVAWDDVNHPDEKAAYVSPVDHCDYKYIAHAEASPYIDPSILTRLAGRSYSGALKYRQLCRSVLIVHKLQWIQHHHYLLRADGEHQNHVEVERDFRDLEAAMDDLLANPAKAQRIAEYSVKTFRERYLTVAAEACYWRSLVRTWGEVTKGWEVRLYEEQTNGDRRSMGKKRGVRYETFMLYEWPKQMAYPKSAA